MHNVRIAWVNERTLRVEIEVDERLGYLSRNGRSCVVANTGGNVRLWREGAETPYRLNLSLFLPVEEVTAGVNL